MRRLSWGLCLVASVVACGGDDPPPADARFDLDGPLAGDTFFDLPFPSDLRLDADGTPTYAGFPNKGNNALVAQLIALADARVGFPVMPTAYFRFAQPVPARVETDVIAPGADAPILIVDVDPDSPERGHLVPAVARTLAPDDTALAHLLAVAPRPGFALAPSTTYAVVVRRAVAPALVPDPALAELAAGRTPVGARGADAARVYAPLWPALAELGVPADDVLAATVLTTGDEQALLARRSEAVRAAHDARIANLRVDPTDGAGHQGYCELLADVTFPQFQTGTQPFSSEGVFVLDAAGTPIVQGELTVPMAITIPDGEMPVGGWPVYQFMHGSGGRSSQVVDRGKVTVIGGEDTVGEGPGFVVARHRIAAFGSALPVNPERFPGATDYEYLNLTNLTAMPYTFQQGVFEQRLLLDAMLALRIPPATLAGCRSALPAGEAAHRFAPDQVTAGGQSMGGMYVNLVAAVDARLGAIVPTGAGGFWNLMILETELIPGARGLIAAMFASDPEQLSFLHPGLGLLGVGWEIVEPMAAMARLQRRPLPGGRAHHVYQPVGRGDRYFSIGVFDAAALAYGNQQAGALVWPSMQAALTLDGLGGLVDYPVRGNVTGALGASTGVVVQYEGDGLTDPHNVFQQLDEVKHQYGCFLESYLRTGTPVVPAPAPLGTPCPI